MDSDAPAGTKDRVILLFDIWHPATSPARKQKINELMGPTGSASDVFLADPRQDIISAIKALEEMQKEIEVANVEKDLVKRRVSSSWGDAHNENGGAVDAFGGFLKL